MDRFRLHLLLEISLCLWICPSRVQLRTQIYVQETGQDEMDTQPQADQPNMGEKPPKCKYSFVVNELDSSKCPILLDNLNSHYKSTAMQSEQPMGRRGRHGNGFRNQANNYEDSRLNKRIEMLEDKLSKETEENQVLRTSLEEHSKLLMRAEKTLDNQNVNLTNLLQNMQDLNYKLNKQRMVWRNMDNKLSGMYS